MPGSWCSRIYDAQSTRTNRTRLYNHPPPDVLLFRSPMEISPRCLSTQALSPQPTCNLRSLCIHNQCLSKQAPLPPLPMQQHFSCYPWYGCSQNVWCQIRIAQLRPPTATSVHGDDRDKRCGFERAPFTAASYVTSALRTDESSTIAVRTVPSQTQVSPFQ